MIKLRYIVVFAIIIIMVLLSIQLNTSNINTEYGISIHNLNGNDAVLIQNLGTTWIRSDVGSPNWNIIYSCSVKYNFKILGILDYYSVPTGFTLQQWNNTVKQDVLQYNHVTAWEIWNEPDLSYSWDGYLTSNPLTYFNLTVSAYNIIHKYAPSSLIIGFGGYNPPDSNYQINWANELITLGIAHYTNALSLHLYQVLSSITATEIEYKTFITSIKAQTNENLWVSETGTTNQYQKSYINTIYPMLINNGITHIFWYDLIQGNSGVNTGLVVNGNLTSGYYALQSFIRSGN